MTFENYPLAEGEYAVFSSGRRMEWGMALLCLISVPVLIFITWGSAPAVYVGGCIAAFLLCWYGVRLIVCGHHDWAAVTNKRVMVCSFDLLFREKILQCDVADLKSYRIYQSARSSRKELSHGELELSLSSGKKFSVPQLAEENRFLEAIRRCMEFLDNSNDCNL